jgi:hypothetical protein
MVSDQAPACPNCGRPKSATAPAAETTRPASALRGWLTILGLGFIIFVGVSMCHSGSDNPTPAATTQSKDDAPAPAAAEAPAPKAQPAEAPIDLNDTGALDKKYGIFANGHCESDADDYLRSIAQFDFNWDKTGFLEFKFDRYSKDVQAPGVLTMVSNKAKLQNGFGAYQHIELFCDYDTQKEKVLGYRVVGKE